MRYEPIIKSFSHFLHGGDYNPDQWLDHPEVIEEDFRMMHLAGCNTFSIGIFAWTSYEPEEGVYCFDWLDRIMDQLAAEGFKAILATPSGAMPAWMAEKYPEIRRINGEGLRVPYQNRHNHCGSSPVYREKVAAINRKLAERYANHPALAGWHVSNEYNGECYCELCLAAFHHWLEAKYGTLDAVNNAWWTSFWSHRYTAWSQINPRDKCVDGLTLDWKRFITWQCCDFMRNEVAPLRKFTPNVPLTTNMMGVFDGLDYWRVAEVCDFIADDCYPDWDHPGRYGEVAAHFGMLHDMHRSMKQGRPFVMIESAPGQQNWKPYFRIKRPGVHQLEMMLAMGHGADGTLYFQWRKGRGGCEKFHGAVVDHVSNEHTRMFREVANVGAIQHRLDPVVGSGIEVQTAIIHDWEARWALDACGGPANACKKTVQTIMAHYRALFNLNVPMDVIESTCDFSQYRLLVAPMLFMLKPGVADRLRQFVSAGGTLVFTYLGGYVNATNLCFTGGWPGDGLRELFGIWNEDIDGFPPEDTQCLRTLADNRLGLVGDFQVVEYAELIHLEGATALATYGDQFYAGEPALTVNSFGQGEAYYLAARTGDDFLTAFYRRLTDVAKIVSVLPATVPSGIHGQIRTDGERRFLFLYNLNQKDVTFSPGTEKYRDMITGKDLTETMTLSGFGSTVVEVL